jgi:hypothetical protein
MAWNPTRVPAEELTPALRAAALGLRVDAVTAEVVLALRSAGVRPILLKGPSIATWLYADGTPRPYGDTDLMIERGALASSSRALRAAGFREQPGVSSYTWFRRSDESIVDLHDVLFGIEASSDEAWAALAEGTESLEVGGVEMEALSRPARLLYIALHAAQHEIDGFEQAGKDLERALAHAEAADWEKATTLARRLQATATFAAGLRLRADGVRLADRMTLPRDRPLMLSLREEVEQPLAVTLERLATMRGRGARLRFVARRLVPPPNYMRWRYPTLAARGHVGLGVAYLLRPLSTVARLPAAIIRWRRMRRASKLN